MINNQKKLSEWKKGFKLIVYVLKKSYKDQYFIYIFKIKSGKNIS